MVCFRMPNKTGQIHADPQQFTDKLFSFLQYQQYLCYKEIKGWSVVHFHHLPARKDMVEFHFSQDLEEVSPTALLETDEVVAIVDDSPEIALLFTHYLTDEGFNVVQAGSASEFQHILHHHNIALVLLDIGLPDKDGDTLLGDLTGAYPDLGIIMITGTTDIDTALECLRQGADDYLTKPVAIKDFSRTILNTLKKRRLVINSRRFQRELESSNNRMKFLHQLNYKMNSAYLNARELRGILKAILVGITADEGLRFNRAFLALVNNSQELQGQIAIGPSSREKAGQIWESIKNEGIQLDDILSSNLGDHNSTDISASKIIQSLSVPVTDETHILIHALKEKQTVYVSRGKVDHNHNCRVPDTLLGILDQETFVVVPLYSPSRTFGVIIVDNYVTQAAITSADINDLEIFASQASLAIEHSYLYEAMANKISELELVTSELEKNKDLLLKAERSITINKISTQLLHALRNPVTSIGGTSRLLTKKSKDPYTTDFLKIITSESDKIEQTLEDLFSYTEGGKFSYSTYPLYAIIRETAFVFYTRFKESGIEYKILLDGNGPEVNIDESKIRQVFSHLIRNSTDAMRHGGGLLEIASTEDDDSITISITDSGPGIEKDILPRVMEPFYTTKSYGNGMGLALVNQIISGHKGQFAIANIEPHGLRATVTLPKT